MPSAFGLGLRPNFGGTLEFPRIQQELPVRTCHVLGAVAQATGGADVDTPSAAAVLAPVLGL